MSDAFLLGAGFSKAVCKAMPTMGELYDLLKPLLHRPDSVSRGVYEYADGNVETLLSYYAIPSPHDEATELLSKRRVASLLEDEIGRCVRDCEEEGAATGLNPNATTLLLKWHKDRSHVLTTNYDTLVERIASKDIFPMSGGKKDSLFYSDLYPIPVTYALARDGGWTVGSNYPETFTLYKLHGSACWYRSPSGTNEDQIYGLTHDRVDNPKYQRFVADKRRFIVPPVYDKSSLLNHESVRSLWRQARSDALQKAENVYVIGYSLPETDAAMQTLLWEGSMRTPQAEGELKSLYVVDVEQETCLRYVERLGAHYDVRDDFVGGDAFDKFVEAYVD